MSLISTLVPGTGVASLRRNGSTLVAYRRVSSPASAAFRSTLISTVRFSCSRASSTTAIRSSKNGSGTGGNGIQDSSIEERGDGMKSSKEKKKAMKAEKEQEKTDMKAEKKKAKLEAKAAKDKAKMELKGKRESDMTSSVGSAKSEVPSSVAAALQLLEFQRQAHAQDRKHWEDDRADWKAREARLLDTIEALSRSIAEMASSTSAHSSAQAQDMSNVASVEAPSNLSTDAEPAVEAPEGIPEPVLGGRGILDVIDTIEEVNKRFKSENVSEPIQVPVEAKHAEAPVVAKTEELPEVEVVDTDKEQPPELKYGDDDIVWVNQLQAALLREGLYCGEEEMEEWYFGHHTQEALMTFQAMKGFAETGVCDMQTWEALLGPGFRLVTKEEMPVEVRNSADEDLDANEAEAQAGEDAAGDLFAFLKETKKDAEPQVTSSAAPTTKAAATPEPRKGNGDTGKATFDKWPVIRLDDGGAAVHHLQAGLEKAGFACDEDEMRWWMFGDTTKNSVEFFQACNGLTETGIVDEHTWRKLLGNPEAVPADIASLIFDNSFDEDLERVGEATSTGKRVWLVGEQRWSDPEKIE